MILSSFVLIIIFLPLRVIMRLCPHRQITATAEYIEVVNMSKGGRPKKEIDFVEFNKLIDLQCTGEEIAGFFNVDYDTLNARVKEEYECSFSDYYKKFNGRGKISLRRLQWKRAEAGSDTMLVWLGKQVLGQTDKQDIEFKEKPTLIRDDI